jgi:hypothetical protein
MTVDCRERSAILWKLVEEGKRDEESEKRFDFY